MTTIDVRPVTKASWGDFARLMETKGAPHFCWCTIYRFSDAKDLEKPEKKRRMQALVKEGTPIGVLAYEGDVPIGWCSVAPRESYVTLRRSRVMPRVTPEDTPTWAVLCLFVLRAHRGKGIAQKLVEGAVSYARKAGAEEIEAYPSDTAGVVTTHQGHSSVYAACGFVQDEGRRWVWRQNTKAPRSLARPSRRR